ncbi:MAG: hypothetical protein WCG01_03495 [bacterium]
MFISFRPKFVWIFLFIFCGGLFFSFINFNIFSAKNGHAESQLMVAANCTGNWLQANLINSIQQDGQSTGHFPNINDSAVFQGQDKQLLCGNFFASSSVFTDKPQAVYLALNWLATSSSRVLLSSSEQYVDTSVVENQSNALDNIPELGSSTTTGEATVDQENIFVVGTTSTLVNSEADISLPAPELSASSTDLVIESLASSTDNNQLTGFSSSSDAVTTEGQLISPSSENKIASDGSSTVVVADSLENSPLIVDDGNLPKDATGTLSQLATSSFGFKIRYSVNGVDWHDLVVITPDVLLSKYLLPISDIEQLRNLSISIESINSLSAGEMVLLANVELELNYEPTKFDDLDPNPQPNFNLDQKIYSSINDEYEVVLLRRKLKNESSGELQIWFRPIVINDVNLHAWNFVTSGLSVGESVPPIIRDGNLFWTSSDGTAMYQYNIQTQGMNSQSIDEAKTIYNLPYLNKANELEEVKLDSIDDKFQLETGERTLDANENIIDAK